MKSAKKEESRTYTYGDYCGWDDEKRYELIDGVVYDMTPAPSRNHSLISGTLFWILRTFFEGKPCEVHAAPFDVRLPKESEANEKVKDVVQPDILVVCDEKKLDDKGCRGAPDLIIEVLSPSTASKDCIKKRALYENRGVKEFWLVDPSNRVVTVYSLQTDRRFGTPHYYGPESKVVVGLFPGLEIELAKVFPLLPKIVGQPPPEYVRVR